MKTETDSVLGADMTEEITQHIEELGHQSGSTRENAAQSLANFAKDSKVNQDAIRDAGGISRLVALVSDTQPGPVRQEAVRALANLAGDNAANQDAIRDMNGIPSLVGLLTDAAPDMCRYAVRALSNLVAGNASNQDEVYGAGAIAPLLALLKKATPAVRAEAACVLASIANRNLSIRRAIGEAGGIVPLLALIGDDQPDAVCLGAVQALANLANEANQRIIREKGGITALVRLLADDVSAVRVNAVRALGNLSNGNATNQDAIREENGINSLLKLLGDEHSIVRQQVAGAIANMVADNATNKAAIRSAGGIDHLVICLSDSTACAEAVRVLYELSKNSDAVYQDAIREAGAIPPLIELLSHLDPIIRQRVMAAIVAIVSDNAANKMAVCAAGGVIPLVACLNDVDPAVCLEAIPVLCELSENSDALIRDAIREAGAISSLITLLGNKNLRVCELAVHVLASFGLDPINQDAIREAGGLFALVKILPFDAKSESKLRDEAELALVNLVRNNVKNLGILVSFLVESLRDTKREVVGRVMRMLRGFALDSSTKAAFREVGGIVLLFDFLASDIKKGSGFSRELEYFFTVLIDFCEDQINQDLVLPSLFNLLVVDARPEVRKQVERAIYSITARGPRYKKWEKSVLDKAQKTVFLSLFALFNDAQYSVRLQAVQSLPSFIKHGNCVVNSLFKKAFCEAGGMTILESLLHDSHPAVREQTAAAFCVFVPPHGGVVREAGVIASLVRLLGNNELAVRKQAARTLVDFVNITTTSKKEAIDNAEANEKAICAADGITSFVKLLRDGDPGVRESAARMIVILTDNNPAYQEAICVAGGISSLVASLCDENPKVCQFSVRVLARFADNNQDAIREASGIVPLLSLFDSVAAALRPCEVDRMTYKDHDDTYVLRDAARALANLADNNVANQEAIGQAGGVASLGVLLTVALNLENHFHVAVLQAVLRSLAMLAHKNTANQDAICAMPGGAGPLLGFIALPELPQRPLIGKATIQFRQQQSRQRFSGGMSARGNGGGMPSRGRGGGVATGVREAQGHGQEMYRKYAMEHGRVTAQRKRLVPLCREVVRVLLNLSTNTTGQAAIYSAGGIDSLVKLFADGALMKLLGDDALAVRLESTQMLANLASSNAANRAAICAAGGIPLLVTSLVNTNPVVLHATRAIAALAADNNPVIQVAIRKAAGISFLMKLLNTKDSAVRQYAVRALTNLANQPANQEAIRKAEGISRLAELFYNKEDHMVSKQAGRALDRLGYTEHRPQPGGGGEKTIVEADAIPFKDLSCEEAGLLGEGSYCKVYKGTWKGNEVAIKQFKVQVISDDAVVQLREEGSIAMSLNHSNIIRLHGFCVEPGHCGLVMKYMPRGSLYHMIHNSEERLEWSERLRISLGIAEGLEFLHKESILHGDLKSSNVMFNEKNEPVIIDFGFSKIKASILTASQELEEGVLSRAAPELFEPVPVYTKASDVYGFAMLLWELGARRLPWSRARFPQLLPHFIGYWVMQGKREVIPPETPKPYADLIRRCWAQRADERLEITDIVENLEDCQAPALS